MVNFQIKVHLSAQIDSENYFRVSTLSKADLFSSHNKLVFLWSITHNWTTEFTAMSIKYFLRIKFRNKILNPTDENLLFKNK